MQKAISQADGCSYCEKRIKLDMVRHVANYHLELAQLWRCPVSWCTVWKGTPQDCMEHLRLAHVVPASVRTANLGKWFPPWIVTRQTLKEVLNHVFLECQQTCCSLVSVTMRWSTTIGSSRREYPMSHCEGAIWTISGRLLRSPRLWAGGDRMRIRHSNHPYMAARLPRGVFPTYVPSPDVSFYVPTTSPVSPADCGH